MFGILDDIVDVGASLAGAVVETATLGTIPAKDVRKLSNSGWSVFKISQELGISEEDVLKLLKDN